MSKEYPYNKYEARGMGKSNVSEGVPAADTFDNVRKKKKKAKRRNTAAAILILILIVAVGAYLCYTKFFKIQNLSIEGECPYTEEEMLEGMGLSLGDTLYGKSDSQIKKDIKYILAYIDDIEISRVWPNTMKVKVEKANPTFYISINESMYVLSQNLKVLSKTDEIQNVELENLVCLEIQGITSCVEGEYLKVDNGTDELLKELYEHLEEYGVFGEIINIDVTDRFDIRMSYGTKYIIKLGDKTNLKMKIQFMLTIIDEKKNDGDSGIIDVSDSEVKEATFESFT